MSEQPQNERNADQKDQKKTRSPVERMLVWVLILGLGGLVGYEYFQKKSYQKELDLIQNALTQSTPEKPVKYDDLRGKLSREPTITETTYGGGPAMLYTWKWRGLKQYKIEVLVSKKTGNLLMIKEPGE